MRLKGQADPRRVEPDDRLLRHGRVVEDGEVEVGREEPERLPVLRPEVVEGRGDRTGRAVRKAALPDAPLVQAAARADVSEEAGRAVLKVLRL